MDSVLAGDVYRTLLLTTDRTVSPEVTAWPDTDITSFTGEVEGVAFAAPTVTKDATEIGLHILTLDTTGVDGGSTIEISGEFYIDAIRYFWVESVFLVPDSNADWADGGRLDVILDAINAKTALLGTSAAQLANDVSSSSQTAKVGSTKDVTIACNTDISAKTLEVTFETLINKTDIATVADGSITKSTTNATFALPAATTASERTLRYAVRDTTTEEDYASGYLYVTYDAVGD